MFLAACFYTLIADTLAVAIDTSHASLHCLPCVFHVADLTVRLGLDPQASLRQLYRWNLLGQVRELGGRSGVFANLVADEYPNWDLALRMIMPSAVVAGIEILRRAGWTTQIPYVATVIVNSVHRTYRVGRFEVLAQPPEWFDLMRDGIRDEGNVGLPQLAPAWALADLIKREGWCDCGLGPDDIYWDTVSELDKADWIAACTALGLGVLPINPDAEMPHSTQQPAWL